MSATVIPYERFAARPVRVRSQEQNRIPDRDSPHLTHPPPATDGANRGQTLKDTHEIEAPSFQRKLESSQTTFLVTSTQVYSVKPGRPLPCFLMAILIVPGRNEFKSEESTEI